MIPSGFPTRHASAGRLVRRRTVVATFLRVVRSTNQRQTSLGTQVDQDEHEHILPRLQQRSRPTFPDRLANRLALAIIRSVVTDAPSFPRKQKPSADRKKLSSIVSSPPLAPSSLPTSYTNVQYSPSALNSVRTLPAPQLPPPISTSAPQPPSSSSSLLSSPVSSYQLPAQSGVGAKFKQALLANRRKKPTQGSSSTGSDVWDENTASSPTSIVSSPSKSFPTIRIPPVVPPPSDGSLNLNSPTSPPQRLRLESKISAFTAGLRKHHAIMSHPPISPSKPGPTPPPKPVGLRAQPSNSNLQLEKDQPVTPRPSDSSISSSMRPLTPTIVAAQNLAAASSIVPKSMAGFASRVVGGSDHGGSGSGRNLLLPGSGTNARSSFAMPDSPSISAALSYMQNIPPQRDSRNYEPDGGDDEVLYSGTGGGKDKEKKREQRRSAAAAITTTTASGLKPVPEGSSVSSYTSLAGKGNANPLADLPPRTDSLQNGGLSRGSPGRGSKRRSASLGDVFRGGFTPAMARAAVTLPQDQEKLNATVDSNEPPRGTPPAQSGRPIRPTHFRAGSSGNTAANQNPVAAAYQYINAEVDGKAPFLAPKLPSPQPSPHPSPAVPPAHPMRRKNAEPYASGNESSGGESAFARGLGLRGGLKGRLAAWTAAATASPGPPAQRVRAQSPHPPGAYPGNASMSSTSTSPASPPSSLAVAAAENMLGASYLRTRSNSSLPLGSSSPSPPNPKRLTATIGNTRSAEPSYQYSPEPLSKDSGYISSSANTSGLASVAAGSIGAASGMALNLGKKGWDRMGNFLGHRAGQSGSWGLSGYGSTGEDSTRESVEGGTMSDSGSFGYGTTSSSGGPPSMLGTMVRPATRRGRGAVFGARLETCVRETRIVIRGADGQEPRRGEGAWVTALVTRCIEHLMHWGMEEEGLFRISGRSTHIAKIRAEFDTGKPPNSLELFTS